MPHSLTIRQREVLTFVKAFIKANESSPTLANIAGHFGVTAPTAHNYLKGLQAKGYLYFSRDSVSGFFIRVIERAGASGIVLEVGVAGKVDQWGELHEFPQKHSHFATLLHGVDPENVFALQLTQDIPTANISGGDLVIFDQAKKPQPGDICIARIGERYLLVKIDSRTFDAEMQSLVMKEDYPMPEELTPDRRQYLNWYPLAYDDNDEQLKYFEAIAANQDFPIGPIPPEFIIATALRLSRRLAF